MVVTLSIIVFSVVEDLLRYAMSVTLKNCVAVLVVSLNGGYMYVAIAIVTIGVAIVVAIVVVICGGTIVAVIAVVFVVISVVAVATISFVLGSQ